MNVKELKELRRIEDARALLKERVDSYPECTKHKELAIYRRDGLWFCERCLDERFERYEAFDEMREKFEEMVMNGR